MKIIMLLLAFIAIGGIGNYFAVRHKPLLERKKWWLKYFVYVGWVLVMVSGIWFVNWFFACVACLVIIIGFIEIFKNLTFKSIRDWLIISAYALIALGFIFYGFLDLDSGSMLYLYLFVLVCIYDAFSQISGQLFGRIKILKRISPNKTLEGFIGGTLIMALTGWFLIEDYYGNYFEYIYILIVAIGAPIGDILSSKLKRYMGVKDFSNYFPGQGGVLDRYDSHIFTGFFYYVVIQIIYHSFSLKSCVI